MGIRAIVLTAMMTSLLACGPRHKPSPDEAPKLDDLDPDQVPIYFRGYAQINRLLRQRLIADPTFDIARYLAPSDAGQTDNISTLPPLIAGPEGKGTHISYSSATPSPMTMFVWFMAMDGLSKDIARRCDETDAGAPLSLQDGLAEAIDTLCQQTSVDKDSLLRFWDMALRDDASPDDRDMWLAYNMADDRPQNPITFVQEVVLTALFNQDFLAGK